VENPGGYLRITVVNLCRNRKRRNRQDRQLGSRLQRPQLTSLDASEMVDLLLRLPYRQRAVLVLRYWGDWSEAEIASSLKCRPGTVKTLASRGLDRLRREVTR
jgi:RNA polymerase sigma factor (sigma-70 family)